jgi:hypothetical protein
MRKRPLHLASPSPNYQPVETWHSVIKRKTGKSQLQQFSLKGCAQPILSLAKKYDTRAEKAATAFTTKTLTILNTPGWRSFLSPSINFIWQQMKLAEEELEDGDDSRYTVEENIRCTCFFYRRYQLICRHIWANHIMFKCLTNEHFDQWAWMWDESGFQIYERMETVYFERDIDEDIGAPECRRLDMREVVEAMKERYYQIEEAVGDWEATRADNFIKLWIHKLNGRRYV